MKSGLACQIGVDLLEGLVEARAESPIPYTLTTEPGAIELLHSTSRVISSRSAGAGRRGPPGDRDRLDIGQRLVDAGLGPE